MSFLSGISIVCFAASYMVAWFVELARLVHRSGARRAVMLGFVGAGLLAHTVYLVHRATTADALPLSSSFDWCLLAAWLLMALFLCATFYYPRAAIGLVVLPIASALVVAAALLADRQPVPPRPAVQTWGIIHGTLLLLATVVVTVGFVAGLLYLIQASRLKRRLPPWSGFRFPSLELLERVNTRVIFVSLLLVAAGFGSGAVLAAVKAGRGELVRWGDPVIWTSAIMLLWLAVAAAFNAVYRPARHGRKVAYLTVASFVFLVIVLAVFLLVNAEHGGGANARTTTQDASDRSATAGRGFMKWDATLANSEFRLLTSDFARGAPP